MKLFNINKVIKQKYLIWKRKHAHVNNSKNILIKLKTDVKIVWIEDMFFQDLKWDQELINFNFRIQ